jgi:hypothetical protein
MASQPTNSAIQAAEKARDARIAKEEASILVSKKNIADAHAAFEAIKKGFEYLELGEVSAPPADRLFDRIRAWQVHSQVHGLDPIPDIEGDGLTTVLRWAIRQFPFDMNFSTRDIAELIEKQGQPLGVRRKFVPSALVKLRNLNEIEQVVAGTGREPTVWRRPMKRILENDAAAGGNGHGGQ